MNALRAESATGDAAVLSGGGEAGALMRAVDWARTPVGPVAGWPQSLKTAVRILLECRLPMYLAWGREFTQFYNDAYRPILGHKHPAAMGNAAPGTWPEIWGTIGPMWEGVWAGKAIGFDAFKLTIERFGYPEDCYFNFSYSPVPDDAGDVAGVLVTFVETTAMVMGEQRSRFLNELAEATRELTEPEAVMTAVSEMLGKYLGVSRCAYAEVAEDSERFTIRHDYTNGCASTTGAYQLSLFGPRAAADQRAGRTLVVHDVDAELAPEEGAATFNAIGIKAIVCCPLVRRGRLVAMMAVHQVTPRRWKPEEVSLVEAVVERSWANIERARDARVLRESEAAFRQLADAMPQIVWAAGADGVLDYYNRRWFEYIDVPPTATDAARWDKYIHPDDLPRAYAAWEVALKSGEPYVIEFRVRNAGGAYRWFLVRALRVRDTAGKLIRWFGTCTDIHDQKELQAQNERLLQSERAARGESETANKAKDRFLAVLSHELRTPLTPVALVATAMELDPRLPFELREDVGMIRRNVELETRLIDDLLDLSRVISGKLRMNTQPTRVHRLIRHVLETVGAELHEKQLAVEVTLNATRDLVDADPARLQQTLWNLLKNAAKFTPAGGRVAIRTADVGPEIAIDVVDSGKGIDAEILPRIFDPFEQGVEEVTRRFGGMGLGLAIAKAVVDLHGGKIAATSDGEGKGATFRVTLPLQTAEAQVKAAAAGDAGDARVMAIRMLLVEDHADSAKILVKLLRLDGIEVHWVTTVEAAVSRATAEQFDVIVSDLGLPDGSGHEMMREVQKRRPVAGIAMSGYGMEDDIRRSREAGFVEHLVKPINLLQLREAIKRVAGSRGS